MALPPSAAALWHAWSKDAGGVDESRFYEVFSFGDSPALADELAQLVLAGTKRATAGAVWVYETSGKGLPRPGHLSVVTDSRGEALCIIETLQVDVVPFNEVTAEFAATEGEGDGSLAYWRQAHHAYFTRECERAGRLFSDTMLVACERFRVVFARPA